MSTKMDTFERITATFCKINASAFMEDYEIP